MIYFAIYILGCVISLAGTVGIVLLAISENELDDLLSEEDVPKERLVIITIIGTLLSWVSIAIFISKFSER
ncbi:hypothetical protein [Halocella sp. SP3-1]|uniref:hypothetical protein n=1 Tax=Halocella sp. SP3-1 TaxID=2382161 RepID=UPI000F7504BB|nr:hypothetical protein [Halocella sp. SP3-1]AZO96146.1 hypothetical protein D7D81_16970 [Halocella sp. SP3-1]